MDLLICTIISFANKDTLASLQLWGIFITAQSLYREFQSHPDIVTDACNWNSEALSYPFSQKIRTETAIESLTYIVFSSLINLKHS